MTNSTITLEESRNTLFSFFLMLGIFGTAFAFSAMVYAVIPAAISLASFL